LTSTTNPKRHETLAIPKKKETKENDKARVLDESFEKSEKSRALGISWRRKTQGGNHREGKDIAERGHAAYLALLQRGRGIQIRAREIDHAIIDVINAREESRGAANARGRVHTSPSALFFSSSLCLACSSAMRASIAARDSRVNGRNKLLSSSDIESESSDIV